MVHQPININSIIQSPTKPTDIDPNVQPSSFVNKNNQNASSQYTLPPINETTNTWPVTTQVTPQQLNQMDTSKRYICIHHQPIIMMLIPMIKRIFMTQQ